MTSFERPSPVPEQFSPPVARSLIIFGALGAVGALSPWWGLTPTDSSTVNPSHLHSYGAGVVTPVLLIGFSLLAVLGVIDVVVKGPIRARLCAGISTIVLIGTVVGLFTSLSAATHQINVDTGGGPALSEPSVGFFLCLVSAIVLFCISLSAVLRHKSIAAHV